jgi:acetyl-CoA synthetase
MTSLQSDRTLEIADGVPPDSLGAAEIGFAIPQAYNASRILFDNLLKGRGDRPALTGPAGTHSYGELCAEASRWGHGFQSLGLKRGDRILMFLDDTPAYPAAFFGAVRAGFVPLLINTLTPPDLLQFYLSDSGATVAVADAEFCSRFDAVACNDTALRTLITVNGAAGDHAVPNAIIAAPWLQGLFANFPEADTHRNEMAFWMYSSGSTGRPKGIVHLQHDMAYSEAAFARNVLKLKPDDICFSVPKIFFAYGFGNSIAFPFSAGAATLLLPGQPKPPAIFEAIERFHPSVFFGLPTLYTSLTKAEGAAATDFSSLRMALSAAEVLSADVFNGWKSLTGIEIVEGLGSTEVLHIYLSNRPEKKKLGAAGLRVPGYEIALGTRTAGRLATTRKASFGYAAIPIRRCTGTGRTNQRRPSARKVGFTPATALCAIPTAFIFSAAAPMISSKSPANGCIRSRSSFASPSIPGCASARCLRRNCRTGA